MGPPFTLRQRLLDLRSQIQDLGILSHEVRIEKLLRDQLSALLALSHASGFDAADDLAGLLAGAIGLGPVEQYSHRSRELMVLLLAGKSCAFAPSWP